MQVVIEPQERFSEWRGFRQKIRRHFTDRIHQPHVLGGPQKIMQFSAALLIPLSGLGDGQIQRPESIVEGFCLHLTSRRNDQTLMTIGDGDGLDVVAEIIDVRLHENARLDERLVAGHFLAE